ncbi:MAG: DUF1579 domain-containing protein [Planctomycetia bacterium]|nr:DUF1579 domain-containing protein [Planctomycetia bacterium]
MHTEPQKQHDWLHKLTGKWSFESECNMGPDQPPGKFSGTLVTRSLGGVWILGEGEGEMPGGDIGKTLITLGYDPLQDRYVGSFIGSMMTFLWIYNGSLDADEKILTLDTEGPNFTQDGLAKYQDIITWVDEDHHILTSQFRSEDGRWNQFMTAHYRRQK